MANIDQYLDEIEVASRGEEVRDSIIDAFEALNSEGPGTMIWDNITDTPDTLTGYGVSEVPASMVSGVLALNNIPPSALERVVPVADDTARFALTSSDVQNGDTVKVLSTLKLYLVVDDTSLSTEAGYEEYRAGTADSVDWSGVLNTPDTLAGYGIGNAYTKDEVDDITTSEEEESDAGNPIVIEIDAAQYAKKTHLTLEPVQDLHGYDHPWPAGGGKNLLPMTVAGIKAANTSGSWNGNAYTMNDVTFTIQTDADNNVTGIKVNGTASARTDFNLGNITYSAGTYNVGGSTGGSISTWVIWIGGHGVSEGEMSIDGLGQYSETDGSVKSTTLSVMNGTAVSNKMFYPIVCKSSETDKSFAPYSNICPITGVDEVEVRATGKNLAVSGYPWNINASGAIAYSELYNSCIVRVKKDETYTHSINGSASITPVIAFYTDYPELNSVSYNASRTVSGASTFTAPIDGYAVIRHDASDTNIQVELGSIATDYEPYQGYTASLDLPEPVYSGTLDLETGEVVVDKAYEEFSGNETNYGKHGESHIHVGYIPLSNSAKDSDAATTESAIFDKFKTITKWYVDYVEGDGEIYNSRAYFFVPNASDATDVKNYVQSIGGFTVCYELATPKTYQLTPQQLALFRGINNISTNAKTVQVTYRNGELATTGDIVASTEVAKQNAIGESASYTDTRLATELALILGNIATAETSPASASHAVGEYLLYNNRLFKVLAAISAGQQLTIGTNVGQTNVAAELASQASAISALNSNKLGQIPRCKDITSYFTDGTLWNRISGTGYPHAYYDIQPGDYIDMGRTITCPNIQQDTYGTVGSRYVTVVSLGGLQGNGGSSEVTYNHLVMVPGQGVGGSQHFGRHRMNPTNTTEGGYVDSQMFTDILGAVVSAGSVATGATINQQLYYVFGSHLKTTRELLSNAVRTSLYNRLGSATGASSGWAWTSVQACLMSEVEVYGSVVWSSSAYDTGSACKQFELFAQSKAAINNRSAYYWLKDVASSSSFARVNSSGDAFYYSASGASNFVRPRFIIA